MTKTKNKTGLFDTILLALTLVLLMIGVHQIVTLSRVDGFKMAFYKSYWIFMFVILLMLVRNIRKQKQLKEEHGDEKKTPIKQGKGKK